MKKILSILVCLIVMITLVIPKTEVRAEGTYNEHTKVLKFSDNTLIDRTNPTTRVQYGLVEYEHQGKKIPAVEYVFTYNPEFNELPERQSIGFILPTAVTVPLKIIKIKEYKTGNTHAVPQRKEYVDENIINDWLSNYISQYYASKLTVHEGIGKTGTVNIETYQNKTNKNNHIYKLDDQFQAYLLKGYTNENLNPNNIKGYNKLKEYLDGDANQMFVSWEPVNNRNKYTFIVYAPLRDPNNTTTYINDVEKLKEDQVANLDLTAIGFISSKYAPNAKMYKISGVKSTVKELLYENEGGTINGQQITHGIADSDRETLKDVKKISLADRSPVTTTTDQDFDEEAIKNKVYAIENSQKKVTHKPDYKQEGANKATVTVTYPDGSSETIDVPTLSVGANQGLGDPKWNHYINNEYSKIKHLQDPATKFEKLQLSDKEMIKGIIDLYNNLKDNGSIPERQKSSANTQYEKDLKPLLDKINEWEKQIQKFRDDHRELLGSNAANLKDKSKIENALKELNGNSFSNQVKKALETEKAHLEKLLENIKQIEEKAKQFITENTGQGDEISKDTLNKYNELGPQGQEALKAQNPELAKKMDEAAKKAKVADINDKLQKEADNFKKNNENLLNKKVDDVQKTDEEKIHELKKKYDDLIPGVKDLLETEKTHIEKLVEKIEELKNPVEAFKKKYKDLIEKKAESVDKEDIDKTIAQIDEALAELNKLPSEHKDKLSDIGEKISNLKNALEQKRKNSETNQHDPNQNLEHTVLQHSKITANEITDLVKTSDDTQKNIVPENNGKVDLNAMTREAGDKTIQVGYFEGSLYKIVNITLKVTKVTLSNNTINVQKGQELSDDDIKNSVNITPALEGAIKSVTERPNTNQTGSQTAKVTVTYPNGDTEEISIPVEVTESNISSEGSGTPESGNSTQPSTPGPDTGSNTPSQPENTKPQAPEVSAKEDGSVTITPKDSNTIDTITITYTPEGETNEKTLIIKKDSKDNNKWKLEGTNPGITIDEKTGKVTIPADKVKDNTKVTAKVQKGDSLSSETSTDTSKPNKQTTPNTNQGSNGNTTSPSNPSTSNNQTKPQANYLSDKNTGIKAIHDSYKDDEYELIIERKPNIKPTNLNNNQGIEVYDIKVRHKTTKQLVTNFNPALKIYVPTTNKIIKVVHISDNDHKIQDQTYNFTKQDQGIQFSTNHLSLYGLVYENSKPKQTVTHNPNWQQDLRKHNEFISKHNKETNKTLPNTGHINNHSILLASTLLTLVAYKLYKKED